MKTILFAILLLCSLSINAQIELRKQSVDAGGSVAQSGTVKMLFSVGEVAVAESVSATINISESFVSADMNLATKLNDYTKLVGVNVFPNPTSDEIHISLPDESNYQFELMDMSGKVLKSLEKKKGKEMVIKVNDLVNSTYLLLIKKIDLKQASVYKIVINH